MDVTQQNVKDAVARLIATAGLGVSLSATLVGMPFVGLAAGASSLAATMWVLCNKHRNNGQALRENLLADIKRELRERRIPVTEDNIRILAATLAERAAQTRESSLSTTKKDMLRRAYEDIVRKPR